MSNIKACLSTGKDDWETPEDFFREQERKYGTFDLDACATKYNSKCLSYFSPEEDGLKQKWFGNVWCNPAYSKGQPNLWIRKAIAEVEAENARQVVMLLRCDTSTKRWHDLIVPNAADWFFVRGRIKFVGGDGGAPFASVIVVFRNGEKRIEREALLRL